MSDTLGYRGGWGGVLGGWVFFWGGGSYMISYMISNINLERGTFKFCEGGDGDTQNTNVESK